MHKYFSILANLFLKKSKYEYTRNRSFSGFQNVRTQDCRVKFSNGVVSPGQISYHYQNFRNH